MKSALRWMAHNHVASNLLMLILVVGGLIKGPTVKQEVFPEVSLDRVQVSVAYPGAGPQEVEEGILLLIEENLTAVDGIKEVTALAAEGVGTVTAEVLGGEDVDLILQDIKGEVDRITTFPEDAEKPVIRKLVNRREVISLVVYGELSERSLRERAEALRDELLALPQITQVELGGVRPFEIAVEIAEADLRRYGLTMEQVAAQLRKASVDLPGGTIKTDGGQILLRTKERRYWGEEYADLTIVSAADGTRVRLGDIATVRDTFRDTDEFARFDGHPAAMVKVYRVGEQKPTEISELVHAFVKEKRAELPPSVRIATWNDTSEMLSSRMELLTKNAWLGLSLVLIILGLFLEIRLALWVMVGIPISFFGTLFLLPSLGVSINMISLFAFILALGILVDDAIVVGENIYEHRQQGKPYLQASVEGVQEVAIPVIFSILTTVAAFLPLAFVSGMMGKFIGVIPLVVITLLLVSLIECLFVLPAHLAIGKRREFSRGLLGVLDRNRRRFGDALDRIISGPYRRLLDLNLRYRYASVAIGVSALLLAVGLVRGGVIKFQFMPTVEGDLIIAAAQLPRDASVQETARIQRLLEEKAQQVVAEIDAEHPADPTILRNLYAVVGSTIAGGGPGGGMAGSGAYLTNVALFLSPSEERRVESGEVTKRWREAVGHVAGVDSLTFQTNLVHMGANIDVQLAHEDFAVLDNARQRVRQALAAYPGVSDIEDTYAQGKKELRFRLTPAGRTLGLTSEELGRQVRGAFYGAEALRLQRGRNEVRVMVRYPEAERQTVWDLANLRIRTPDGGEIPLHEAAQIEQGVGFSEIHRTDRKRVVDVTASVDAKQVTAREILEDLRSGLLIELKHDYPGLSYNLEGEEKERRDSVGSMLEGFQLAIFAIFALLAIVFRSYSQPFLIMVAIPFGIIGALLGHLIMGYNLSILSLFGIVALSGVVVNDSLLLIDRTNGNLRRGMSDHTEALLEAGQRRFRPILLTSLTTFFGLAPMILETSVQARFLIPMAISLGFGILFATGITLLLIPALYLVLEDVRALFGLGALHARAEVMSENAP